MQNLIERKGEKDKQTNRHHPIFIIVRIYNGLKNIVFGLSEENSHKPNKSFMENCHALLLQISLIISGRFEYFMTQSFTPFDTSSASDSRVNKLLDYASNLSAPLNIVRAVWWYHDVTVISDAAYVAFDVADRYYPSKSVTELHYNSPCKITPCVYVDFHYYSV